MATGSGGAYGRVPGQAAPHVRWGTGSATAGIQTAPAPYSSAVPGSSGGVSSSPQLPVNPLAQSYTPGQSYGFGGPAAVHPGLTQSAPPGSSAFTCSPSFDNGPVPNSSPASSSSTSVVPTASEDGIPEPPSRFPELESMPIAELRVLSEERSKFDDFISKHSHSRLVDGIVSRLRADVDKLEAEQKDAASRVEQAKEDDISEIQREIEELQIEVNELQVKQDGWMTKYSLNVLLQRLRAAIRQSEAECERLEEEMLAGDLDFDQFLKQYLECRKLYHERSLKLEQLKFESKRGIAVGR